MDVDPDEDVSQCWDAAYLALIAQVEADGAHAAENPLSMLSYTDLIDTIAAAERASRAAIATGMAAAAELGRRAPVGPGGTWQAAAAAGTSVFAPDHLALAMGVSKRSAQLRLNEAVTLATSLPRTLAALSVGLVGMPAVRALISETQLLSDGLTAHVESQVLDALGAATIPGLGQLPVEAIRALPVDQVERVAGFATSSEVRRRARRAVTRLDPDSLRTRAEAALETRAVLFCPEGAADGMSMIAAILPEAGALAGYTRLCDLAAATTDPDDPRSIDQVRADVLLDLLLGVAHHDRGDPDPHHTDPGTTTSHASSHSGREPERAPWATPGVAVNLTLLIDATGTAETNHGGPISSTTLQRLVELSTRSGGTLKTITQPRLTCPGTHPHGGSDNPYQPSTPMRRTLTLRNPVCVYPGCAITATACDLDHTVPWPHGPTCPCNLAPLCRHHHRLKTHDPGWTLTNHGNGHHTWTTPWGTTYEVTP